MDAFLVPHPKVDPLPPSSEVKKEWCRTSHCMPLWCGEAQHYLLGTESDCSWVSSGGFV